MGTRVGSPGPCFISLGEDPAEINAQLHNAPPEHCFACLGTRRCAEMFPLKRRACMSAIRMKNFIVCLALALGLTGCGLTVREYETDTPDDHIVRVVLEEDSSFYAGEYVRDANKGEDVSFTVHEVCGRHIVGTDYRGNACIEEAGENTKILTFEDVRYSTVVSVRAEQEMCEITYHANGGQLISAGAFDRTENDVGSGTEADAGDGTEAIIKAVDDTEAVTITVPHTHIRVNTKRADELFVRPGYTLLGWSSSPSGEEITAPGSRIDYAENLDLYAVWARWTPGDEFTYTDSGDGIILTGLADTDAEEAAGSAEQDISGNTDVAPGNTADTLVIPGEIDGRPVYGIAMNAFANLTCRSVILPMGLHNVENGAFRDSIITDIYLFDDLRTISGHAFDGCGSLKTLRIGAATAPVYSGNYFDTFADKYNRLLMIRDEPKIVLFSGSSARFGYDSAKIEEALGMRVVNMGVFAYSNALPELLLIRECMNEDDILLVSPEFDAAQSQFCIGTQMEYQMFAMCEGDYEILSRMDLTQVSGIAAALDSFLTTRRGMRDGSYDVSAADFDEDGHPVTTPSYNEYGDYILYRPNAESEEPVYGLGVNYTKAALPKSQFIDPFNRVMETFLKRNVEVFFTYSPRNLLALSPESTEEARAELHEYLCQNLTVPVISDIEESLYTGTYLYGTDNHLSTEGVSIRTERVIRDLRKILYGE